MNNKSQNPIGVMDSGVGGLTIWREILHLLPHENTVYFADSKNIPYGNKSIDEIRDFSFNIVEFLLKKDCKIILVACNSITTTIIKELREQFDVPFIGIEPAIKVAALNTKTKNIGVLATEATMNGELFNTTKEKLPQDINVHFQIGYDLVEIIEEGRIKSDKAKQRYREFVSFFQDKNVDQVVMGCTHYPFIIKELEDMSDNNLNFIDPAVAVVRQIERILNLNDLESKSREKGKHQLYSSGSNFPVKMLLPELDYSNIEIIHPYSI